MLNIQYDIKRRDSLKSIISRFNEGETNDSIEVAVNQYIEDVGIIGLLLIQQALINGDEITVEEAKQILPFYVEFMNHKTLDSTHPIRLFQRENRLFQAALEDIWDLLQALEKEESTEIIEELQRETYRLGEFHKHYHRKEKLLFPVLERYGYLQPGRLMWENDDRIRALYLGIKRRVDQFPNTNVDFVKKRFLQFQEKFEHMIYEEEAILFPIMLDVFNEVDWQAVAVESEAFGYAMLDDVKVWQALDSKKVVKKVGAKQEHLAFGGGYLTTEEANLILNNLPLEITFVDKHNVFKYFNEMTEASDMMLVRTPLSIGRNVTNCHPPKSLRKVMMLMRDLISGKRRYESMWFKKKGQYIHLTYKALFDETGDYVGILEYVQDIQPFFELSAEVKMGLSPIVE